MTKTKFQDKYAPGVSLKTVDHVLHEAGIKKWLAKRRPKLKLEHPQQWLDWALECRNWTAEDFKSTIWSDECSVEKSKDPRQVWVF